MLESGTIATLDGQQMSGLVDGASAYIRYKNQNFATIDSFDSASMVVLVYMTRNGYEFTPLPFTSPNTVVGFRTYDARRYFEVYAYNAKDPVNPNNPPDVSILSFRYYVLKRSALLGLRARGVNLGDYTSARTFLEGLR